MVKSVLTRVGREKLCKAHAGDISLPPITQIAFGDGGVDSDGNVISVTGEEVSLRNELMRKDIDEHFFPERTTGRYCTRLDKLDLAKQYISEMGLFDSEGDLVAYRTTIPKGKDDDESMIFDMDEIF
ncbi:MAG: hypothetical protein OSJ62_07660 [Lachnospiraceae bacterium]|nr:hypothetical protein [Lachnospiraceae bacterium]